MATKKKAKPTKRTAVKKPAKKAAKKTAKKAAKRNALFSAAGLLSRKPRITADTWEKAGERRRTQAARYAGWGKRSAELATWSWRDIAGLDAEWQTKLMRGLAKTYAKKNPAIVISPAETSLMRKIVQLSSQPTTIARARQLKALRSRWSTLIAKKNSARKNASGWKPASQTPATPPSGFKGTQADWQSLTPGMRREIAQTIARALIAKKNSARKRKANPRGSAAVSKARDLVKRFVGRASGKETAARHPGLKAGTVLGNMKARLDYLLIDNPSLKQETRHGVRGGAIDWTGSERPEIASEPGGRQYVFLGGNQAVSQVPPLAESEGMLALGEVMQLGYTARKHVDDFKLQSYYHNLGEETGERPYLCYDPKQKQLYLTGGNYRTEAEGMAN